MYLITIDAQDEVALDDEDDAIKVPESTKLEVNHGDSATLDTTPVNDANFSNINNNKNGSGRTSPKLTVIHDSPKTEEEVVHGFLLIVTFLK